jgi:hypothetical protein
MRRIDDRECVKGTVLGFDVDDAYAFDIDETVSLTLTYAPQHTGPFFVVWDMNGGVALGRTETVQPEQGAGLRRVTLDLSRARLAGQGSLGVDFAVAGGDGICLCDIEIARSGTTRTPQAFGLVRLHVQDGSTGRSMPARVGLFDQTGRMPLPSDHALLAHRFSDEVRRLWVSERAFWPSRNRQAFYAAGTYEARVPVGRYELVVTRGLEYRAHRSHIEVTANGIREVTVSLTRYANLPSQGWYSNDAHIHIERDRTEDANSITQMMAEDVHLSNLLQMGNIARNTYFFQPAWGKAGHFERDGHVLVSGQEDPRTVYRGHTIHHNIQRPIHQGSDTFFLYHRVFEESRRQGGLSGYAHRAGFNARRSLALDVPFGIVDFIEVLQFGRLATDIWYELLNLGYKLLPAAGSDYPYVDLPGVVRGYAKPDGPFTVDSWFDAFRRGRTYVTNGPFLEFTVNGQSMGDELRLQRGARLEIEAEASLNPDVDTLNRLELVVHGEVIQTVPANGRDRIRLKTSHPADKSLWIAVRAYGDRKDPANIVVAHSAPTYVIVENQPFWKREAVAGLVALQRTRLAELISKTAAVDIIGDSEPWETRALLVEQWARQLPLLEPRIAEADARYREILERIGSTPAQNAKRRGLWLAVAIAVLGLGYVARRAH